MKVTPDAPEYDCKVLEGATCIISLNNANSYTYIHSDASVASTTGYSSSVHVAGLSEGTDTIYVKYGSTYRAILNITVEALEDVVIPQTECEIWELEKKCEISLTSANVFDYSVSEGGVVAISADTQKVFIESRKV